MEKKEKKIKKKKKTMKKKKRTKKKKKKKKKKKNNMIISNKRGIPGTATWFSALFCSLQKNENCDLEFCRTSDFFEKQLSHLRFFFKES